MRSSQAKRQLTETSPSLETLKFKENPLQTYAVESHDYDASIDYGKASRHGLKLQELSQY